MDDFDFSWIDVDGWQEEAGELETARQAVFPCISWYFVGFLQVIPLKNSAFSPSD